MSHETEAQTPPTIGTSSNNNNDNEEEEEDKDENMAINESVNVNKCKGLASAPVSTRLRVASLGGTAFHHKGRGLQTADKETRKRVALKGGKE
jgi:hypothetical protein